MATLYSLFYSGSTIIWIFIELLNFNRELRFNVEKNGSDKEKYINSVTIYEIFFA